MSSKSSQAKEKRGQTANYLAQPKRCRGGSGVDIGADHQIGMVGKRKEPPPTPIQGVSAPEKSAPSPTPVTSVVHRVVPRPRAEASPGSQITANGTDASLPEPSQNLERLFGSTPTGERALRAIFAREQGLYHFTKDGKFLVLRLDGGGTKVNVEEVDKDLPQLVLQGVTREEVMNARFPVFMLAWEKIPEHIGGKLEHLNRHAKAIRVVWEVVNSTGKKFNLSPQESELKKPVRPLPRQFGRRRYA